LPTERDTLFTFYEHKSLISQADRDCFFIWLDNVLMINNRAHPRFEAKPGKWVKLRKKETGLEIFQLIDVSQGGMSFVSLSADEFKRGDHFVVEDFKDRKLKHKIIAIVRYVQTNLELDMYTDYKVGVEFLKVAA
jgi:hypothetical protein